MCSLLPPAGWQPPAASWLAGRQAAAAQKSALPLSMLQLPVPHARFCLHPFRVQELERNVLPLFELLRGWGLTQPELRKLTVAFPNLFLYRAETIEVGRVITPAHHGSAALRSPVANMTSLPAAACLLGACAG